MRKLLKSRNLKRRDCTTVVERCHVLPPLPSPIFAPHCVLLGYTVLGRATVRKDHMTSVTSRATIHNAAFSACHIPAFIRETEGSAVPVEYEQFITSSDNWEISQFNMSQYDDRSYKWSELIKKWIITEENKRSAGEELMHCDYNKTETVIIECKFRLVYIQ
jgi:hypothetical protein